METVILIIFLFAKEFVMFLDLTSIWQWFSNALRQGEDIGNDLALLAHANHSILSHGTYGMWGALLAGGETVLPGYYKKVKESREIDKAKLPGWVFL